MLITTIKKIRGNLKKIPKKLQLCQERYVPLSLRSSDQLHGRSVTNIQVNQLTEDGAAHDRRHRSVVGVGRRSEAPAEEEPVEPLAAAAAAGRTERGRRRRRWRPARGWRPSRAGRSRREAATATAAQPFWGRGAGGAGQEEQRVEPRPP